MAVATKEIIKETESQPQAKTFKAMVEQAGTQEYHYLHRIVGDMPLPDGTLNGPMLDEAVMAWTQGKGYRIHSVHFLGQHKGVDGNVHGYVYGYHLVRG